MTSVPEREAPITGIQQPPSNPGRSGGAHQHEGQSWWRLKKIWKSLILFLLGVVFFFAALRLYSTPGELSTPSFATIQLQSSFSIASILYDVTQSPNSPSIANITIYVQLPNNIVRAPIKAPAAEIWLEAPSGTAFESCPPGPCHFDSNEKEYIWSQLLDFRYRDPDNNSGEAIARFSVKANSFGYVLNDVNASAAIPRVFFSGSGSYSVTPILYTEYDVTSADSFDWSTLQPQVTNTKEVRWDEPVTSGVAQGIVVDGINHDNEAKDNYKTFAAGALIGVAGGMILAAFQEWLHRNDDAATEKAVIAALQFYSADGQIQRREPRESRQEAEGEQS